MVQYNNEERELLFAKVRAKTIDGKWTGGLAKGRPICFVSTKVARADMSRTKKPKLTAKSGVHVAHVVLVMNGQFPQEDEQASHLCHNGACIKLQHLRWESAGHNMRRAHCQREGECVCRLDPPCLMRCE